MSLSAHRVEAGYPNAASVLKEVELDLQAGRFLCLLGPNGTGKSTLCRSLCGLLPLRSGRVEVDGQDLAGMRPRQRARRLGFLPQDIQPAFSFRVEETVALGARVAGHGRWFDPHLSEEALDSVRSALRQVEAENLLGRELGSLSGGERRRVLVASVLAQEPDYLLLDEPAAMLDLHHQAQLFAMLQRLAGEGLGVLCVTHDVNLAAAFADELVLLHGGRVHARGRGEDVLKEDILRPMFGNHFQLLPPIEKGAPPVVLPAQSGQSSGRTS
ncbi:MAG: ABC transporter ATP-binding protein [Planctomycetota bacterium]|nr:MAG: ABC transporter ATP-binding protein [Planctomycetota bacterium]